jgi:colanic acid/amylovoran biosynthesis glycosyltransferase
VVNGQRRHLGYVLKRFPRISETFVAAEIIELERQGEQVSVFAVSRPEEPFTHEFLREMKAPVIYLPHRPLRQPARVVGALARIVRSNPGGWLRAAAMSLWPPSLSGWRHLLQATVLCDEMGRAGVDHAHAHFANIAARLANLAWHMGGPTYSVTAHAKDIYHEQVRTDHLRDKLASATFVATVSRANREYLASILDGESRLHVIPNAVALDRIGRARAAAPESNLVLAVGRLIEKKGLGDLVEACGLLAGRGVRMRLEIVGGGPLRTELEAVAARTGATVVFHGALPYEAVLELYRRAAVFCLPCVVASTGDRDGLPTSVLEAMALGVPVVTTDVNGLRELVVDGETGLVVPARNPPALANALARLLTDAGLAERLASRGRRLIESRYSLESSVGALRALIPEAA